VLIGKRICSEKKASCCQDSYSLIHYNKYILRIDIGNILLNIYPRILDAKSILFLVGLINLSGCSFFIASATDDLDHNLISVILNHNDPKTVSEAIPAYLLMLETLVKQSPESEELLATTSSLYSSYATLIPEDHERLQHLTSKALHFGLRSACAHRDDFCQINKIKFDSFEKIIQTTELKDISALYTVGSAWASWIQANSKDWDAVAQLPQVKAIMKRIIALDETYKNGSMHIYLGVLETYLPPAMGGDSDAGKFHFEQAIALSEQKNLLIKVIYASKYARLLFDRKLHDTLLNEVVNADPVQSELTLINTVAQQQAKILLKTADNYF